MIKNLFQLARLSYQHPGSCRSEHLFPTVSPQYPHRNTFCIVRGHHIHVAVPHKGTFGGIDPHFAADLPHRRGIGLDGHALYLPLRDHHHARGQQLLGKTLDHSVLLIGQNRQLVASAQRDHGVHHTVVAQIGISVGSLIHALINIQRLVHARRVNTHLGGQRLPDQLARAVIDKPSDIRIGVHGIPQLLHGQIDTLADGRYRIRHRAVQIKNNGFDHKNHLVSFLLYYTTRARFCQICTSEFLRVL